MNFCPLFGHIEAEALSAVASHDATPYTAYLLQRMRAGSLLADDAAAVRAALARAPAAWAAYAGVDVEACVRTPLDRMQLDDDPVVNNNQQQRLGAAQRFEHGGANIRVKLCVDAAQAVLRGQLESELVELFTTPILAAEASRILPLLVRVVPDLVSLERLAPALLALPSAAHLVVAAGLLFVLVCNTPNERSLEVVVDACLARFAGDAARRAQLLQQQQQLLLRSASSRSSGVGSAGPSASDVVLAQLLLRLCCLSPRSAQTVTALLAAAVASERVDVRRCHVPAFVVLRVKSELLGSLVVPADAWLRTFVRQFHDNGEMGATWRLAAQGGSVAPRRRRLTSALAHSSAALLQGDVVPDWPLFAALEGETEACTDALDPTTVKNALHSTRQLLLTRLRDAGTAPAPQLAALVRAFALLYGVLGARPVADEVGKLVDALVERLSRPEAASAVFDDLKQLALCFVFVCEGVTRLSAREQLVRLVRAALFNDSSPVSLLITAHLAASSETGVASVVRGKLDAPLLVFNAESFKTISSLVGAVADEQRALQQCLALPARGTSDAELACVYHFLTSGSFERHAGESVAPLGAWMWRLLASVDEHVAAYDAMHPLLPAVVDEFVLFAIARRDSLRSGAFAAPHVRQALSEWRAGSVPSARCCLLVYYVLRFNDESRMAHEARIQKRLDAATAYARFDESLLALLPLRAIFRAATHGAAGLSRFMRDLLAAIHPPIVGLAARLVAQSLSLASQLDGSAATPPLVVASTSAAAPPPSLGAPLSLAAVAALADAPVDVRVRALAPCLATLRRHIVRLHKRRGLTAVLALGSGEVSALKHSRVSLASEDAALALALHTLVESIWPVAHDALPSRASAELVAALAAPTRGVDRTLAGIAWGDAAALQRDAHGGAVSIDDADDDDDGDDEEVQFDADLCKDVCVSDPLAAICGADRAMLACEPLFGLLIVAFELFLVASRKHYADSLSMFALVANSGAVTAPATVPHVEGAAAALPQTTAEHYNRLRDALISTQESTCVGVLAELATSRWLKRLFAGAGAPLDAAQLGGMSQTVCALLHRLYCTHPPLLSMSLLHLADPELVAGDVCDAELDNGDPSAADDACAATAGVEQRESELDEMLSVLCERVPSLHAAVSTIHSVVTREKSSASKLVLCARLLAHLALLPLYRVPQTLDVCSAVLNRMMHGRGQADVQFLKQAVLCLPALCVAFPTLVNDALAVLVDLCPLQLRAKHAAVLQARRTRAEPSATRSLLPSAADVLLYGDALPRKRARAGDAEDESTQALLDAEARARELLARAPRLAARDVVQCTTASERMQALLTHRCVVVFDAIVQQQQQR